MTNELKQRLVGAVVITAIAAIFLPMLFDDPVHESGQVASEVSDVSIPEPPQVANTNNVVPEPTMVSQEYPSVADREANPNEAFEKANNGSETQIEEVAHQGLSADELALEAAVDKKSLERMSVEELAALKDKKEREKILRERLEEDSPADKIIQEHNALEKKIIAKIDHLEADRKVKDKLESDQRLKEKAEAEKKLKLKSEADLKIKEKLALDKKAKEKSEAEKLSKDKLDAKVKLDSDKKAAEKLAKEQVDYQKLAAEKAKEKALAEKKAAEKLAADNKIAAKQQAEADKAAQAKIAADKLAAEKASSSAVSAASHWYIRVGSFSQEANANAARDKLRKQGYTAVVDIIKSADKGKLYRLRVGPESSKVTAEKNRQKIDAENKFQSILELE